MELPLIPHLCWPLMFLTGLCSPFNLDVHHPRLFPGPPETEFGYSVLQHVGGGRRWMLVGAPWDGPSGDRRGDVYRCPVGGSHNAPCAKGHLGDYPLGNSSRPAVNMHLGMSLLETDGDGGFMVSSGKGGGWVSEGSWQRKEPYVRETGLCGGGTEFKTLESEEGNLGEGPQCLLLLGACSVGALPSLRAT
ncbi:Integrin alpha-10 [Pteropus alecto]|uniref:Integrin alpha-10 n=1 Tax=Pteropus alecto TaxID=9402 RepID=L5K692_PTEAL|nr:Integrin alpha-10 [Pteropus alecto]